ncbi:MAG: molybdopterin-dependent oxidoreductase [Acidobacteriota bacterium]|nr:molybdopterin-dependent oxidoreductase [Acidobacteriota bacterium]MDH3524554.1 molybdopterin-dependent oxidoreductase [Acidobacteriota bacterium]
MILPRRDLLKMLGVGAGAVGLGGCRQAWSVPDRLVELALRGPGLESQVQTICGLCAGGCGLTVRLVDGLPVGIRGNPHHPLNRGGLCPVGLAGLEVLYAPGRLQGPLRRQAGGEHGATTWEEALDEIATRLTALTAAGQGDRVAFLSGEPSELFHDLARRFLHGLGSANLSRLDDAGLAHELTQGIARAPGYDLGGADLVVSFGLDLYEDGPTPIHATAAMIGSRPTEQLGALIQVGTRVSPSASKAEIFALVRPGTLGAFALGIAHTLVREGGYDRAFVAEHTFGFDDWTDEDGRERLGFRRLLLERYYPDRVAALCGCDPALIVRVARRLAAAAAPVAVAGGDAVRGTNATWTQMAVQALNALTGAFDRPGGVVMPPPIPLTPLAALPAPPAPSLFAAAGDETAFGVDPVEALAAGVLDGTRPVELLIVLDTNPVFSSPAGDRLREALARIPTVVALASFMDETAAAAELVLPTPTFLERWQGATTPRGVAFSTLGLAPPVVEPLTDARHPGDVLLELGRRLGGEAAAALPWSDYPAYLKQRIEGLALSGQGSVVTGSFEESWIQFLEERGWRFLGRKEIESFWRTLTQESSWWNPVRSRGDWGRLFATASGRYEFFSRRLEARLVELGAAGEGGASAAEALARGSARLGLEAEGDEACMPHHEPEAARGEGELTLLPFRPITARGSLGVTSPMVLEMFGYTAFSPWQTWAELAAETAHELDLGDGDEVRVESDRGHFAAVVRIHPAAAAGTVHVPLGLGHEAPGSLAAGIGANPVGIMLAARDPLSGRLSRTATRVRLALVKRRSRGGPPPRHGGSEA